MHSRHQIWQGLEFSGPNSKFPYKGLWLVQPSQTPYLRPFYCVLGTRSYSAKDCSWAPLPYGRGRVIPRKELLNKQPKDELTTLALNLHYEPPQDNLYQRELWSCHFDLATWPHLQLPTFPKAPRQPITALQWDQDKWGYKTLARVSTLPGITPCRIPHLVG